MQVSDKGLVDTFHKLFYESVDWRSSVKFLGVPVLKNPLDLWTLQELIVSRRPNVIVETGTAYGGSALFYSFLLEQLGWGIVVSVDVSKGTYQGQPVFRPVRGNLFFVHGDSSLEVTRDQVTGLISRYIEAPRVMVLLDSNHTYKHVRRELENLAPLTTPGQYLVVEDTNTQLVLPSYDGGKGARAAVEEYVKGRKGVFEEDEKLRERWGFSFNTWLLRS